MIRAATPGDVAAITAIYAREVLNGTASFEIEAPDEVEMARRLAKLGQGNFPVLVAGDAEGVAGYAYAGPFRERAAFRFTVEDSIYVAPRARGRGIGAGLLGALVSESTGRGFRQMVAVIGDGDNVASVALHRRAGFAAAGTLRSVGFKFGRWLDAVVMQRPLGASLDAPGAGIEHRTGDQLG